MEEKLFGAMQGWQCPICKRVYSPYTSMCHYCGGDNYTTTTFPNNGGFVKEQSSDFKNPITI